MVEVILLMKCLLPCCLLLHIRICLSNTGCSCLFTDSWAHNFWLCNHCERQVCGCVRQVHWPQLIFTTFILPNFLLRRRTILCMNTSQMVFRPQGITPPTHGKRSTAATNIYCSQPSISNCSATTPGQAVQVCPTWWQCRWVTEGRSSGRMHSWRSQCGSVGEAALRVELAAWWFGP